jgi:hypothetical protein|tara:strand:+ start:338 stop:709 length:372 start_codon:yes stop_codon:yes gene_type:complete
MARKTTTLLPLTGATSLDTTGTAVPGDSYYGYTDGIHTVAVYGSNLTGRISIQGTLATTPTEADWFDILLTGMPYKDYSAFTGVQGFTFVANLVYLRAKLDRTSLGITDYTTAGHVGKIYLNY